MESLDDNYKYQYHVYKAVNIGTGYNETASVFANVVFPVKKIKFNFGYVIETDTLVNFLITADITNNDIVGTMNQFVYNDGVHSWLVDGLKATNSFSYIFKNPLNISGNIVFTFTDTIGTATITSNNVVIHMEFLG